MAKNYIEMGGHYHANPYGLVKVVCRGFDHLSGEAVIAYANIGNGGIVGDIFMMPEEQFKNIFLK